MEIQEKKEAYQKAKRHLESYRKGIDTPQVVLWCIVECYLDAIGCESDIISKIIEKDVAADFDGVFKE